MLETSKTTERRYYAADDQGTPPPGVWHRQVIIWTTVFASLPEAKDGFSTYRILQQAVSATPSAANARMMKSVLRGLGFYSRRIQVNGRGELRWFPASHLVNSMFAF